MYETDSSPLYEVELKEVCDGFQVPKHVIRAREDVRICDSLGRGEFGEVYKGYLDTDATTRFEIAIKEAQSHEAREMLEEAKAMIRVTKHEHIVNFQGICIDGDRVYLLLEFCSNGSIQSYMWKKNEQFLEELKEQKFSTLLRWCVEVAKGMDFLASEHIIHGDLAARNILLNNDLQAKIADFGMATRLYADSEQRERFNHEKVPMRITAYEILKGHQAIIEKSDVWSYGVLLWELFHLCNAIPYPQVDSVATLLWTLENDIRPDCPLLCPRQIHEWMKDCWKLNHNERPSFKDLKKRIDELDYAQHLLMNQRRPQLYESRSDPTQNSTIVQNPSYLPTQSNQNYRPMQAIQPNLEQSNLPHLMQLNGASLVQNANGYWEMEGFTDNVPRPPSEGSIELFEINKTQD